jgi:hypothetical protein
MTLSFLRRRCLTIESGLDAGADAGWSLPLPLWERSDRIADVNAAVTLFVYTPPTISPGVSQAYRQASACMLRFKVLASVVPLLIAAAFARGGLLPGSRPCIAIGDTSVEIADLPWQAQLHVSFTDDPAAATVRVQIADSAEAADFAVVDDVDSPEAGACEANAATQLVAIFATPSAAAPVIYLSPDGPADYRIFVRSKSFTARDAAALIVGASGTPPPASRLALNISGLTLH